MVTAISFGARLSRFAQRAASTSSAVESGPPDTASTRPGKSSRPRNSAFASPSATAASAVGTLLFPVDALLHAQRGARIFAQHFAERGAGRFLFAERRKRHAELQQRIGRPRGGVIFGRHGEEGFRGIAIALALEQGFAHPELRVGCQPIARILAQEIRELIRGGTIVLVLQVAVSEIEFVLGRIARRQRRLHGARAAPIARWRRRRRGAGQIERRAGLARTAAAGWHIGNRRRRFGRCRAGAERTWRAGCSRIERRIECITTTAPSWRRRRLRFDRRRRRRRGDDRRGGSGGRRRRILCARAWRRLRWRRRERPGGGLACVLQRAKLLLELLIAVLQLLPRAGELTPPLLEAVDAGQKVGLGHLRASGTAPQRTKECGHDKGNEAVHRHFAGSTPPNIAQRATKL